MSRYAFTIEVDQASLPGDEYDSALYEAGCDDALVAVVDGRLMVDFEREGDSYDRAVASAVQDLERAGAKVVRVASIGKQVERSVPH
jgi:hypothetical protein